MGFWRQDWFNFLIFRFGNTPVISLHDYPTIYETFHKNGETFTGREHGISFLKITKGGDYGIVFVDGPIWKEQKKFGLRALRDLGVGRDVMQEKVLNEISYMLQEIQEDIDCNNKEIDMRDKINRAIGNIINLIVLGYRFEKVCFSPFWHLSNLHILGKHWRILWHQKGGLQNVQNSGTSSLEDNGIGFEYLSIFAIF